MLFYQTDHDISVVFGHIVRVEIITRGDSDHTSGDGWYRFFFGGGESRALCNG